MATNDTNVIHKLACSCLLHSCIQYEAISPHMDSQQFTVFRQTIEASMPPPGVTRVSSSSSLIIAPTSSVITPPVVETNVDRKGRSLSYVDLRRICQRLPRVRVDLRPGRYGTVFVDLDAIAVSPRGLSRTHR